MHKLSDEPKVFYDRYINHNRENFWSEAMTIGVIVHSWIEGYYKGNKDIGTKKKEIQAYCYKKLDKKREEYISRLED